MVNLTDRVRMFLTSMQRNSFALAFLTLCSACTGKTGTPEDALRAQEALIHYQMTHNHAAQKDIVDTFCVEISNVFDRTASTRADPPAQLVERLNGGSRKVRKVSDCDYNGGNGVFEKGSHNHAIVLIMGEISWESETRLTITGGYYEALESASGNVYHLEKRNGIWVVTKDELKWIS